MRSVRFWLLCSLLALAPALAAAQARGGTAAIAVLSDPGHRNPAIANSALVQHLAVPVFDGPIGRERKPTPRLHLAQSWAVGVTISRVPFANAAGYSNAAIDRRFAEAGAMAEGAQRGEPYRAIPGIRAVDLAHWWPVEANLTIARRDAFAGCASWSGQFAETAGRLR